MISQAQPHDVRIELLETEIHGTVRYFMKIHLEEIDSEFPIYIVELVLIFLRRLNAVRQLLEIAKVKRALWIGAFVNFEMLTVFLGNESVPAVWAKKHDRLRNEVAFVEDLRAYLALILSSVSVVVVYVQMWCSALGANNPFGNGIAIPPLDWPDHLVVLMFVVSQEKQVVNFLKTDYLWELIDLEFLVLGAVGIVKFPLTHRNVLSYKYGLLINNVK